MGSKYRTWIDALPRRPNSSLFMSMDDLDERLARMDVNQDEAASMRAAVVADHRFFDVFCGSLADELNDVLSQV